MKFSRSRLKPLLRWVVLGLVLFVLATVLRDHWQDIAAIRVDAAGWRCLAIALMITLLAHICAGWVWSQLLRRDFQQPVPTRHLIQAYLQTNIAKYLPGNIWHYYGRISAATTAGASLETATVSVVLEPLLMAAAALLVALLGGAAIAQRYNNWVILLQGLILAVTLAAIRPQSLNPLIQRLAKLKHKALPSAAIAAPARLNHYPFRALLGNVLFLLLRATGFLLAFRAVSVFEVSQIPLLLSGFSLAWLLGLVVPGAPGGLGIFEVVAIALLGHLFPAGILLAVVALYRFVSVTAEAIGAGLAWLSQRVS